MPGPALAQRLRGSGPLLAPGLRHRRADMGEIVEGPVALVARDGRPVHRSLPLRNPRSQRA